jgi:hypothetical protein
MLQSLNAQLVHEQQSRLLYATAHRDLQWQPTQQKIQLLSINT